MTIIKIVAGDKGYDLNFTLQNSDGTALDLTGATLKFITQLANDTAVNTQGSMTVVSAAAGTCKYTVANGDFPTGGIYNVQIQVTYTSSGKIVTFADIQLNAAAALPLSV